MVFSGGGEGASAAISRARLAIRVVKGRWFMVYACLLIMAGAGATYHLQHLLRSYIQISLGTTRRPSYTHELLQRPRCQRVGIRPGLINPRSRRVGRPPHGAPE
ncbi:hypothetical protein AXF42_Ash000169 [Apostasia shenzhenica]|uniref:Uncharacterized protein n=1 Tax=Apostasia shenzhenica TaxID=1088818 RepID=A0A2I0AFR4_9ASPA|nr:hypothetical protein AXF42_Ash000169 [Apostasia shenzhenica]